MPDFSLIIAGLLGAVIAFFVLVKPLFLGEEEPYFQPKTESAEFSEALSILEMITELDTDFQMGKVSKNDYESLSLDYKHRYLKAKIEAE